MRIALVIDDLHLGGAECVVARLAQGLARAGHGVFVYCLKDAGPAGTALRCAGVTVRSAHSHGFDPLLGFRLANWLRSDRVQLVNAHSSAATLWTLPPATLLGLPVVQTRHGGLLGPPTRHTRLAERLAPLLAATVTVAASLRASLPPRIAGRAVHIPNGLTLMPTDRDAARRVLTRLCGLCSADPILLHVGTLCPEKDVRGLLAAFARVHDVVPDARLVCIGAARSKLYEHLLRTDAERRGLVDSVCWLGAIPDAWRLIAGADVLCLASRTEAMPLVLLEALSQRTPIVATAVGDVGRTGACDTDAPWMIRDHETGLLVPPARPDALGDALLATLRDPRAARRRAAHGYADYVRRFTAERMTQRYEQFFRELVDHPRRRPLSRPAQRDRRPVVLMVGPAAPEIGGMVTVIDALLSGPLRDAFTLERFAANSAGSSSPPRPRGRAGWGSTRPTRPAPVTAALRRHIGRLGALARMIQSHGVDIVHIHTCSRFSFYRSLLDMFLTRALGRRVILHIHGAESEQFCSANGPIARWIVRRGCEQAHAVVVLSGYWRDVLRPYLGRANMRVIPNGVRVEPSHPPVARALSASEDDTHVPRPCRFLFLGAVTRRKGLPELLDAAALLHARGVPFELRVVGPCEPGLRASWEYRLAERGLAGVVRLEPPVNATQRTQLLREVDCLVQPSRHEGLPLTILEAGAAGVPVVATAVGSIPEVLTRPGDTVPFAPLVPAGIVHALVEALERMARDPAYRAAVGAALHHHVTKHYTLERVSARLADLYAEVLARHGVHNRTDSSPRAADTAAKPAGTEPKPSVPPRHATAAAGTASAWLVRRIVYPLHERCRGRRTLAELAELQRLARLGPAELCANVNGRVSELLRFAAAQLPYYRDLLRDHAVDPRTPDAVAELRKLPVLDKAGVRAHAERMVWHAVPGGPIPHVSGGTSGDTLHFFIDRTRQAQTMAARLFMQGLFGIRPGDRRVYLWASPIELKRSLVRRWRDRLLNEIILDAFDMSEARMQAYLDRIRRFRPAVLYGYTSAVTLFARYAQDRSRPEEFAFLRLIVLTGDEVHPHPTAQIAQVFGCTVTSEYGSREVGLIAHGCPHHRLHILAPHVLVETVMNGRRLPAGECGQIVCTPLNTRAQPLLRYRLGDLGTLLNETCTCGLPFPLLRLDGARMTGFIALPDGRLCHGSLLSYILRADPGVLDFRVYQPTVDRFVVLLTARPTFERSGLDRIRHEFRRNFGAAVHVDCRVVDRLPPDPSGKRRFVISRVAPQVNEFRVVRSVVSVT